MLSCVLHRRIKIYQILYFFNFKKDDEYGEKSVCVELDGQEAELTFIDHPANEMSVCNHVTLILANHTSVVVS